MTSKCSDALVLMGRKQDATGNSFGDYHELAHAHVSKRGVHLYAPVSMAELRERVGAERANDFFANAEQRCREFQAVAAEGAGGDQTASPLERELAGEYLAIDFECGCSLQIHSRAGDDRLWEGFGACAEHDVPELRRPEGKRVMVVSRWARQGGQNTPREG